MIKEDVFFPEQIPSSIVAETQKWCRCIIEDDMNKIPSGIEHEYISFVKGHNDYFSKLDYKQAIERYESIGRLFSEGYSLKIFDCFLFNEKVFSKIYDEFEKFNNKLMSCNLYATPHCSQALLTHFDEYDIIVMQVFGTKNWNLYSDYRSKISFTLREGEYFLLKRGVYHNASTEERFSLHLAIGIHSDINKENSKNSEKFLKLLNCKSRSYYEKVKFLMNMRSKNKA